MSRLGDEFATNACLGCGRGLRPQWHDCPECGRHLTWVERVRSLPPAPIDEFSHVDGIFLEPDPKLVERSRRTAYSISVKCWQIGPMTLSTPAVIGLVVICIALLLLGVNSITKPAGNGEPRREQGTTAVKTHD